MAVNTGLLTLKGSTSGTVSWQAPAAAASNTLILPNGNGSSGQVLTTDGAGTLSWATGGVPDMITVPVRTILAGGWDLSTGPFWQTTTAFAIPFPTNVVAGASGLIRFGAVPTGWASQFTFEGGQPVAPAAGCVCPFFVYASDNIIVGPVTGVYS
jgi:hypothetical protein